MALLQEREYKVIARSFGFSEVSARRLLSNTSVCIQEDEDPFVPNETIAKRAPRELRLRIGMHIQGGEGLERVDSAKLIALAEDAIRQYRRACPEVANWVISGDFNPVKIPREINKAKLIHACRTAGRIRAWVFQQIQKSGGRSV
jgi:hypothetical protein